MGKGLAATGGLAQSLSHWQRFQLILRAQSAFFSSMKPPMSEPQFQPQGFERLKMCEKEAKRKRRNWSHAVL
jgi:hypothetical protein